MFETLALRRNFPMVLDSPVGSEGNGALSGKGVTGVAAVAAMAREGLHLSIASLGISATLRWDEKLLRRFPKPGRGKAGERSLNNQNITSTLSL